MIAFVALSVVAYLGSFLCLWSRWCARHVFSTSAVFASTLAVWSLWLWAWEDAVIGTKPMATAFVRFWPSAIAGARIVGTNVIDAAGTAAALAAAHAWWSSGAPEAAGAEQRLARRVGRALAPIGAAALLLALLGGAARLSAARALGSVSVGVPQINVESTYYTSRLSAPELAGAFRQRLQRLLDQLKSPELLVFTEGFDGAFPWALDGPRGSWQEFAAARGQSVLLTSYAVSARGWKSNVLGAIRADGSIAGEHVKVDLAPFGEAPFEAGTGFAPLSLAPALRVGALICQESILPHGARELVRQGATVLAVSTSDVTFGSSVMTFEHVAATQLRAAEVGRAVIWASNAGPSMIIDRFGEPRQSAPFRQPAALVAAAPLHDDVPPFLRSEPLWPALSAAYIMLAAAIQKRKQARRTALRRVSAERFTKGRWRILMEALLLAGVAPLVWLSSPALVEARQGDVRRSSKALTDLLKAQPPIVTRGLERYAQESSARAAVGYFLEYYGADPELASRVAAEPRDLVQLQEELSALGVETRPIDYRQGVPRVASLTRLADGDFAVSVHANGSGPVVLALPHRGLVSELPVEMLDRATAMRGLVPGTP